MILELMQEYFGIVTMEKESKKFMMLMFQQLVILHLMVLHGKYLRLLSRLLKIYFSAKIYRKLYWKESNSLSLDVDGNITVAKNLIGSPSPALPHLPGGTLTDGYDGYYANDPAKGLHMGKASLGGFGGGKGPGKGESLGATGAGGVTGGGGSYAGEGGSAASGPAGIRYGNGGLDLLIGGSGGGIGNGGEAGAGGGAIEMISSGTVRIEPGVRVAMNGGTVFVNPTVGANFSGGAGSGGAVRIFSQ